MGRVKPGQVYSYQDQYLYIVLKIETTSINVSRIWFLQEDTTIGRWSLTTKETNDISLFERNMGWQHVL